MDKASGILLCLEGERLTVFKNSLGETVVMYERCDVKEGLALAGVFGRGNNFESACEDYLKKIRGRTLVFRAGMKERKEVIVLG